MSRYSLMELTVAQVEAVSSHVGQPSNRWDEVDSWVVLASICAVVDGIPIEKAKAMTVGELIDHVNKAGDSEEDPTPASD